MKKGKKEVKQRAIVDSPDTKMHEIVAYMMVGDKKISLPFRANITEDSVETIITSWMLRTDTHTPESLINYINSKAQFGFMAERMEKCPYCGVQIYDPVEGKKQIHDIDSCALNHDYKQIEK